MNPESEILEFLKVCSSKDKKFLKKWDLLRNITLGKTSKSVSISISIKEFSESLMPILSPENFTSICKNLFVLPKIYLKMLTVPSQI